MVSSANDKVFNFLSLIDSNEVTTMAFSDCIPMVRL